VTSTDTPNTDDELQAAAEAMVKDLGDCGITDAQIALRLARTFITKGIATTSALPGIEDPAGILTLFAGLSSSERLEAGEIIARRAGHDPDVDNWPDWLERLLEQAHNIDRINASRQKLAAALKGLDKAHRAVQSVCADLEEEFDVEFVEGGDLSNLFRHHLEQAGIAIRTAVHLNPVKEL
jgi:hypothetical protein